ncbi:MAG: CinA family protein [Planctomycetaceae bacterium]
MNQVELDQRAKQTAELLAKREWRLVCGELYGRFDLGHPDPHRRDLNWLCGSAIVYRLETKAEWLGVSREKLNSAGPVSSIIAEQMATGALLKTHEADVAISITGDLGPQAPAETDGVAWVGIATRTSDGTGYQVNSEKLELAKELVSGETNLRQQRQSEAVYRSLGILIDYLNA